MIKNQKSKLVIALLAISATFAAPQASALGLGNLIGGGAASASAGDPDAFVKSAVAAEKLMNNSVSLLVRSLASKEKSAEFEAAQKAANALTDPAEKQAKLAEVQKDELALLNEKMSDSKFKSDIKKLDGKQREDLGNAAFNFALALLQDKALVEQSQSLVSGLAANPMNLTKLAGVKNAVGSLSNQMTAVAQIAGKMPDIFGAVGVKAPASKDDKPKLVAQVAGD